MAIGFGQAQMERGHPLTGYLNDRAVLVASRKNSAKFVGPQKLLSALAAGGGTVLVCPMCSKKFGVSAADLVPGARITIPDITGPALFTRTTPERCPGSAGGHARALGISAPARAAGPSSRGA
jgi:hypothetical protein